MKKIFFPLALIGVAAFAATTVSLHESVSLKVEPDTMRTTLAFDAASREEAPIAHAFNTLLKSVKRFNKSEALECRGGSYRITPRYDWANGRQQFRGYHGTLSFECAFGDIDAYNRLSGEVDTHLKAWPSVKRRQGGVAWGVTEAREEEAQQKLETKLIRRAARKADHLSEAMGERCRVRAIVFDNVPAGPVPLRLMQAGRMEAASAPVEAPIQSDATVTLGATVTYACE